MAKKTKNKNTTTSSKDYYTKFTRVHLAASGPIVLCKVTTESGDTETLDWNKKSNRDMIRHNTLPDAEICVEKNVPQDRGWNYV